MRKFTLLLSLFLTVLGLQAQSNLVKNSSFETDLTDWTKGPTTSYTLPTVVTGGAQDGSKYVQYAPATATTGFYQEIDITGGKTYVVSFWYKSSGDGTDSRIWSAFKDASNAVLYLTSDPATDPLRTNNGYLPNAADWTKQEITFTAPTNAAKFQFALRAYNGGTVSFDNLLLAEAGGTPTSVTPIITPATGNIYVPTTVSITAGTGAAIYYTTNGTEPTNASTPYTEPFTVSATTTVKAIAYETGKNPSTVATATYTMASATEIPNISGLRSVTLPSTEAYKLTGEAVLTLQSSTRNAKYIQDATGAILIDDASKKITTTYNLGDGITGIIGTLALYNNMLQFTPVADPGAATSSGHVITPLPLALGDLISHQAELVKVSGVTISDIDGGTGLFQSGKSHNLNSSTNPVLRTQYSDLDYIGQSIPTNAQDMVGVVLVYNTTAQFVPRSLAEMVSTGISTAKENLKIFAANGKINFEAEAGQSVEVYNTVGQKVLSAVTINGNNVLSVNAKGVTFVKVGNRTAKVIL